MHMLRRIDTRFADRKSTNQATHLIFFCQKDPINQTDEQRAHCHACVKIDAPEICNSQINVKVAERLL